MNRTPEAFELAELEECIVAEIDAAIDAAGGQDAWDQKVYRLEQQLRAWTSAGFAVWDDFHHEDF